MFKIGEFSKITQVPASALRYYDEIGLFKPLVTDQHTGYRYYKTKQIPNLNLIIAYKELGFNLEQIKDILDGDPSTNAVKGMLMLRQAELEQQVKDDIARLKRVEVRLSQLDHSSIEQPESLVFKPLSKQSYCYLEGNFATFIEAQIKMAELLQFGRTDLPKRAQGPLIAIMVQECYEHEGVNLQLGILLNEKITSLPENTLNLKLAELKESDFAISCIHLGPPNEMFLTRTAMAKWIEESEFKIDGYGREIFLKPPLQDKLNECAIELLYPLTIKDP